VSNPEPVRVVLELERNEQTISGRIGVDNVPTDDFYGWLELIGRLQRATGSCATAEPEEAGHGL
jgi:hypothetical protein